MNSKVRIILDGVFFQTASAGITRVWKSLLQEWASNGFARNVLILDRDGTAPKLYGLRYCLIPAYQPTAPHADRQMLQQICDEEDADLFVSTDYTTPLSTPSVLIVHDMIPEMLGQDLSQLHWRDKHRAIQQANAYLCVSENTAQDLLKFYPHLPPDAITVAPNGVGQPFTPAPAEVINPFKSQYGISKPYFLLVGERCGWQNHKNVKLFFEAFAQMPKRDRFEILCIGHKTSLEPELQPYVADTTVHLLSLPDEELRIAYSGAAALVYPSKYEGFGLPVLEAMACGCPVITCRNGAIPEVAGEAVLYVNDTDPAEMVQAIAQIQRSEVRRELILAGLTQAQKFSWSATANTVSNTLLRVARMASQPGSAVNLCNQVVVQAVTFQDDPQSANVDTLRRLRLDLAQRWLLQPPDRLEPEFWGAMGRATHLLMVCGFKTELQTAAEVEQVATILARLAQHPAPPEAIALMLAAMLYCYPHQIPTWLDLATLPEWFWQPYLRFMLARPPLFQEVGEVNRYSDFLTAWIHHLHRHILLEPDAQRWQEVALTFSNHANLIPLYFAERSPKQVYQQRAEIMARSLQPQEHPLAYQFSVRSPHRHKIRLGVLAEHFKPQTETFATLPIFQHLDREKFEIILYSLEPLNHRLDFYCLNYADAVVELPEELSTQVKILREAELDVLFIATNITAVTNRFNLLRITQLALHRLGRVQVLGMNSPVSSGMPQIDYYLSSALTPIDWDTQQHYTETLIPLETAAQCFNFATESDLTATLQISRETLGIAADAVVFTSGANVYKITPELEALWAQILASVPNSVLLLYPFNPNWSNRYPVHPFRRRLCQQLAQAGVSADRLILLDAVPNRADVKEQLKLADVYLDAYPFTGMTSLLDPLEVGLPTLVVEVNLPVSLGRGAAFLRELGLQELVAGSVEEYVETAIALGQNPTRRAQLRDRILQGMAACPSFLNSKRYAQAVGNCFETLVQEYRETALVKAYGLRTHNYIAFPDWNQPEAVLFSNLADLMRTVITQSDPTQTTLLVEIDDLDEADAQLAISSVTLHLLTEENLNINDGGPEITLISGLKSSQWQSLLPHVSHCIPLPHENQEAIARSGIQNA